MFGLGRKRAADTRLMRRLVGYPAWTPPHRVRNQKVPGDEMKDAA